MTILGTTPRPYRACLFEPGDLVTCPGPFNSGRDAEGFWRRVEAVQGVRWEPPFRGFKGRIDPGFWRVAVPGYSGQDYTFTAAPEGAKAGDILWSGS